MTLLHAHEGGASVFEMELGEILHGLWDEVLLHAILDTLKIIVFLFLTYLLMEFIEHKAEDKLTGFIKKSGHFAPTIGGVLGILPQCGFSASASNLYAGRIITMGTVVAVFLSTSDEMLPIMLSGNIPPIAILATLGYKAVVGILVGLILDLILRALKKNDEPINIDELCDEEGCKCEGGIFRSALHHTLGVGLFVFIITVLINALVFMIGEENLSHVLYNKPFIGHLIAAVFGLIPNCAASVALTTLCTEGYITAGTMMSGLFSGAGVGLLVLFRVNKRPRENFLIMGVLVLVGLVFGLLADLIGFSTLFV